MRPLSFLKGTLVVEVPSKVANEATGIEAKKDGIRWALKVDGPEPFFAEGTYLQYGAVIEVDGRQAKALPSWWGHGVVMAPEEWSTAETFGVSSRRVPCGAD